MHPIVNAMSIHTVEIRIYTDKESYDKMREIVRDKYKMYYVRDNDYDYRNTPDSWMDVYKSTRNHYINGINTIIFRIYKAKDDIMRSYVSIVFNLNTILRGADSLDPYLTIIHPSQIPESMSRVWDFVDRLNICKEEVKIKRIDFSINLEFMSYDEVLVFIELCKKAKWHKYLKDYTEYDNIAHRPKVLYDDSILKRCNSYEISIYSKNKQMRNSGRGYDDEEMERALNVIRMELRIERSEIREILKLLNCNERELLMEHHEEIVKSYAEKLIKIMRYSLGNGDFYSYHDCIIEIDRLRRRKLITENKKSKLISMIKDASKHKSFSWFYSEDSPYNPREIRDMKKTLNKYSVSHIAIPNIFGITRMRNPFTYVEKEAKNCIYGWNRYDY